MLIVGAKGLAQEILDVLHHKNKLDNLVFYDDVSTESPNLLFNRFKILRNTNDAVSFLKKIDDKFILGVGDVISRYKLYHKFIDLGGSPITLIADSAILGNYNCHISTGVYISLNVCISSSVTIKTGSFINAGSIIGHDSILGKFTVICPSCNIGGNVTIGDFTFLGTGVIIYPNVTIGKNVSISAGSIIRKNVPDNAIVHNGTDIRILKIKSNLNL